VGAVPCRAQLYLNLVSPGAQSKSRRPDLSETDTFPAERSKARTVSFEHAKAEQSADMGGSGRSSCSYPGGVGGHCRVTANPSQLPARPGPALCRPDCSASQHAQPPSGWAIRTGIPHLTSAL
jgi:hypothetical protein